MRHLQCTVLFILLAVALSAPSPASAQSPFIFSPEKSEVSISISEESEPLANLFLHLMTRPGVADGADIHALHFAAHKAALSFRQSLFSSAGSHVKLASYITDVGILVDAYQKEYSLAPEGIAGAEGKGAALDSLLDGLLYASVRSGFSLEELDLALLRGAATIEARISEPPLSRTLSLTDSELVLFLMHASVDQVRRRTFLDSTMVALQHLHSAEEITTSYESKFTAVLRPALRKELVWLEIYLADPLFGSDLQDIVVAEFNNVAGGDLFAVYYAMTQHSLSISLQKSLISSLTAVIPGMTPERLQEQVAIASGSSPIPFTTLAVYDFVTPNSPLTYSPVSGLADRLAVLGVTPPYPPDSLLFPEPHRAIIRMNYDILLCDLITSKELRAAHALQDKSRPLSLEKQLILKEAANKRFSLVRAHLGGVSDETARKLQILMQSSLNMRI